MPYSSHPAKYEPDYVFPHMARMATPTGHLIVAKKVSTSWSEVTQVAPLHGAIASIRLTSVTAGVTFSYCFDDGEQAAVANREDSDISMDLDPLTLFIQGSAAGTVVVEIWYYEDTRANNIRGDKR